MKGTRKDEEDEEEERRGREGERCVLGWGRRVASLPSFLSLVVKVGVQRPGDKGEEEGG